MDIKPCEIRLSTLEIAENAAKGLKAGLSKWKAKSVANHLAADAHMAGECSDPELEPVNLLSVSANSASRSHRPSSICLDNLLTEYKDRRPKVEIVVNELEASAADEAETAQWRQQMRQDNEVGRGKICRVAPGIEWLRCSSPERSLPLLPIPGAAALCAADSEIISLLKFAANALDLGINFSIYYQLVEDKQALLNNMFIAMCLHFNPSTVEVLKGCLRTVLSHNYKDVDTELHAWSPKFSDILTLIQYLGAAESYTECPVEISYSSPSESSSESHQHNSNIQALLDIITCSCRFRKPYTADEALELSVTIAKLSLDRTLISQGLTCDFQRCMHALISIPDDLSSSTSFSHMEDELCRRLLSIVKHHHNKLHLVTIIPSLSERAADVRMTLAYLAICQLLADDNDLSGCDTLRWSMNTLAHKYFRLDINESMDMYYLYTMITLFDIAIGTEIDSTEKDDLDAMREQLSKQCRLLRENPMKPDLTSTKYFMHRVILRWNWVVQQATPAEEVLDIKYKPTPTKIIPVNSQEVRTGPSDDEDDESRDVSEKMESVSSVDSSCEENFKDGVKRSLPLTEHEIPCKLKPNESPWSSARLPAVAPTISPLGLERLRSAVRDVCSNSPPGSRPHTPSTAASSSRPASRLTPNLTPDGSPLAGGEDVAKSSPPTKSFPSPSTLTHVRTSLTFVGEFSSKDRSGPTNEMDVEEFLPDLD